MTTLAACDDMADTTTCGDFGGVNGNGDPCGRPVQSGRCRFHCEDGRAVTSRGHDNPANAKKRRERAKRKREVVRIYLDERLTHQEIADRTGLARSTVSTYLNEAEDEWLDSIRKDMSELKAQQLASLRELDQQLREAIDKAETSEDRRKIISERRRILKDISDLLGLDEPLRIEGEQRQVFHVTFDTKDGDVGS